jgi:hypothetical protein
VIYCFGLSVLRDDVLLWKKRIFFLANLIGVAGAGASDSAGGVGNVGPLGKYKGRAWGSLVLLAMLVLQLLRRLIETIHISKYSPLARMHILGYLVGLG